MMLHKNKVDKSNSVKKKEKFTTFNKILVNF